MPLLMMRSYPETLLDQTCRMAVRRQIDYGRRARRALGHLGVAPTTSSTATTTTSTRPSASPAWASSAAWATSWWWRPTRTALAAMLEPAQAARNLRRLAADGLEGAYGFYEAIDYTHRGTDEPDGAPVAAPRPAAGVVVRAYLAHHQGMTLVALANALLGDRMVERFHADPRVRATELLLQERVPRHAAIIQPRPVEETRLAAAGARGRRPPLPLAAHAVPARAVPLQRQLHGRGHQRRRRRQLLPRPRGHAPPRGRRPATRAASSSTCATCAAARSGRPPTIPPAARPDEYLVDLPGREGDLPPPGRRHRHPARHRGLHRGRRRGAPAGRHQPQRPRRARSRSRATRRSSSPRRPTTWPIPPSASCSWRRSTCPRARPCSAGAGRAGADEAPVWAVHVLSLEGRTQGPVEWETDRARFLGRGRGPANPAGARRPLALRHDGRRARPHREPAPAHPPAAGRLRAAVASPRAWPSSRETALALAQQVPRPQRRRPHLRPGLRPRAERPAAPRHLQRGGPALRAPGLARALRRRLAAREPGAAGAQRARPGRPLAARHLRRPAHPARARGGGGRPAAGAPGPAGAGVLAAQGPERGRGDPQRAPGRATSTRCTRTSRRCSTTGPGAPGSTGRAAPTCCAATA